MNIFEQSVESRSSREETNRNIRLKLRERIDAECISCCFNSQDTSEWQSQVDRCSNFICPLYTARHTINNEPKSKASSKRRK